MTSATRHPHVQGQGQGQGHGHGRGRGRWRGQIPQFYLVFPAIHAVHHQQVKMHVDIEGVQAEWKDIV